MVLLSLPREAIHSTPADDTTHVGSRCDSHLPFLGLLCCCALSFRPAADIIVLDSFLVVSKSVADITYYVLARELPLSPRPTCLRRGPAQSRAHNLVFLVGVCFPGAAATSENELIVLSVLYALEETMSNLLRNMVSKYVVVDNLDLLLLAIDEIVDDG